MACYDRFASFYDPLMSVLERRGLARWRKLLWAEVEGERILEVGVGTGRNFRYYPKGREVLAMDISQKILAKARTKAISGQAAVALALMDVQHLAFSDASFDSVVASFVFCSVRDPIQGLEELKRVLRPGGKALFLEHVLSPHPVLAWVMNLANPLAVRLIGDNINRKTVESIERSGLTIEKVLDLGAGIVKLIEARKHSLG